MKNPKITFDKFVYNWYFCLGDKFMVTIILIFAMVLLCIPVLLDEQDKNDDKVHDFIKDIKVPNGCSLYRIPTIDSIEFKIKCEIGE